ncbi:MAG: glutamine-hydrolyzing GMP synthase [Actinomycetota bacterium]|nr:glutamine-hydrolyzing GMP synthase [Actinomycetota bacterium]
MESHELQKVLVVDFGGQYSRLIARRVRECKVYSEIIPFNTSASEIAKLAPSALILSGGPASVHIDGAPKCDPKIFQLGLPILGICYGMQLMADILGGEVAETKKSEYGKTKLKAKRESLLFKDLAAKQDVWMSHRDSVKVMPAGFTATASTESTEISAMENAERGLYGVQFHPEVNHTAYGIEMLKNFLFNAAPCTPSWTRVSIIERSIAEIKERVGGAKIICGLSGGVDSAVAAVLVHKAAPDQLTCVFVDHGLLRSGEADQVEEVFKKNFKIDLVKIDASERFLAKLKGVVDPEKKRVTIGEEFIRVFEEFARTKTEVDFLVQGTLYPDVIESGTKDAAKIKTHHNVGGLPLDMEFKLVEPLRLLFKDEVRAIGEELGLSEEIVWRQPFPGPGLAIRIIGEVTAERLELLRQADVIVIEEIKRAGLYRSIWQSFAVLPCIKSVGVMGDERTYSDAIAIRAVQSDDAMTADWVRLPYEVLERLSSRIINEVAGVNRVVYDISSKPPSTIEWE